MNNLILMLIFYKKNIIYLPKKIYLNTENVYIFIDKLWNELETRTICQRGSNNKEGDSGK